MPLPIHQDEADLHSGEREKSINWNISAKNINN